MTNYKSPNYQFSKIKSRELAVSFTGGDISSDGGATILMEADKKLGLTKDLAKLFPDGRDQSKVSHDIESMIKQRVYGIALGYEDLNDHDHLRKCPALQTIVGRLEDMASSSTLCRFENQSDRKLILATHKLILDKFIASHKTPPKELILDFDATDDQIHGNQENRFYHGYYKHDCFLPLYVFCGKDLLVSYLRSSKQDQAKHSWAILALLVKKLRAVWPEVRIVFRGDGGFCRHKMLDWCDKHNVHYVVGMSQNKRLNKLLAPTMELAQEEYDKTEEKQRYFDSFRYKAKSWSCKRRIVGKAEITSHGKNHRYIVTNLTGDAKALYDEVYCARGDMENRIKEQQLELFSDRTSCHKWWPNQLRLVLSGIAYILVEYIRSNYSLDSGVDHRENKHDGFKATKSGQGGYYNPHTSVKDIDLKDASKAASEHIEACFNSHPDCKEIIIVADPKMLGHIRQDLNSNLKKVIVKEISKDLTHHTTESIESLVFA